MSEAHNCETCLYAHAELGQEPCDSCRSTMSNWEPGEAGGGNPPTPEVPTKGNLWCKQFINPQILCKAEFMNDIELHLGTRNAEAILCWLQATVAEAIRHESQDGPF